jgi:hypothetical protein
MAQLQSSSHAFVAKIKWLVQHLPIGGLFAEISPEFAASSNAHLLSPCKSCICAKSVTQISQLQWKVEQCSILEAILAFKSFGKSRAPSSKASLHDSVTI